jgi:hypothetical protein
MVLFFMKPNRTLNRLASTTDQSQSDDVQLVAKEVGYIYHGATAKRKAQCPGRRESRSESHDKTRDGKDKTSRIQEPRKGDKKDEERETRVQNERKKEIK